MNAVYKYPINFQHAQEVPLPDKAKVINIGADPTGQLCIWAVVDTQARIRRRTIYTVGTGHPIPEDAGQFLATMREGACVWHYFEGPSEK